MPKRVNTEMSNGGGDATVFYADDWPNAYYALVTKVEEARGTVRAENQVMARLDAALVGWYRTLVDPRNPGPLTNTAGASGFRLIEIFMSAQVYVAMNQYLAQLYAGYVLEDHTFWILQPVPYDLRLAARVDVYGPATTDPSDVVAPSAVQTVGYIRNRLIAPRPLLALNVFALREVV
jgi:hypothetical protein